MRLPLSRTVWMVAFLTIMASGIGAQDVSPPEGPASERARPANHAEEKVAAAGWPGQLVVRVPKAQEVVARSGIRVCGDGHRGPLVASRPGQQVVRATRGPEFLPQ
jgi:hypothetical protein